MTDTFMVTSLICNVLVNVIRNKVVRFNTETFGSKLFLTEIHEDL